MTRGLLPSARDRDRGVILPLVLVVSVILSVVVVAIASYAATTLRHGQVVEASSDRVAAAEAGLDWALDRYSRGLTTCDSATGQEVGVFPGEVNGLNARVTCTTVGAAIPGVGKYAIVMTGEDLPSVSDPLLSRSGANSESKEIRGPVYMERPTFGLLAPLTVVNGWLLHHDDACTGSFVTSNPPLSPNFAVAATEPTFCSDQDWTQLFGANDPVASLPSALAPPPQVDPNGCVVWSPGRYDSSNVADFASSFGGGATYNYFISGEYFFDDLGELDLKGSYVLAGYPGIRGPNIYQIKPQDTFASHPCREAWWYDGFEATGLPRGDRLGATWYLGGSSSVFVGGGSALEISGRLQDFNNTTARARVSLQTLDPGSANATTVRGAQEIVTTKSGSGSQLAMRGLVWAPYSSFSFDNVANDVVAALQGGAVVSALRAGAAAQTDGFLIEVSSQPVETQFLIESTATNTGTATVRAIVDYQPSPAEVSVISRRVVDVTPE